MSDHRTATAEHPERFTAWVCQNLRCLEWGRADDRPWICVCGSRSFRRVTLIARADAEQYVRELLSEAA